jgi:hypothetical protein
MKLEELIEKIVEQNKNSKGNVELIVGTIMEDVVNWPAWYYEMYEGEEKYDFSSKEPTSLERLNLKTVKNAVEGIVKGDAPDIKAKLGKVVPIDKAANAVAERVVYWDDWYWDVAEAWDLKELVVDDYGLEEDDDDGT